VWLKYTLLTAYLGDWKQKSKSVSLDQNEYIFRQRMRACKTDQIPHSETQDIQIFKIQKKNMFYREKWVAATLDVYEIVVSTLITI
jgi:hypothetical protein